MRNPFAAAVGMFSILPGAQVGDLDRRLAVKIMLALPWVGILVGGLAGAVLWTASLTGTTLLPAVLGVATLAFLTGGLHLDGLADVADGLGSRRDPDGARAIMRKSDIGPMGVIVLVLVLLVDIAALAAIRDALFAAWLLTCAAMTGRLASVHASRRQGADPSGFGALFAGHTSLLGAVVDTLAVGAVVGAGSYWGWGWQAAACSAAALASALLVAHLWAHHLQRRLGGMSGDTFGSLIELTQTIFLVAMSLASSASYHW